MGNIANSDYMLILKSDDENKYVTPEELESVRYNKLK